ncbi:MAG: AsmA-like C-terminal region-containing protein [Hyphomicrobiaceae bacterium]
MRRKNVISRFTTLALAMLACLLLAVLAPVLLVQRTTDEPFSGYSVMASPRDMHVITETVRLGSRPDLTLSRGTLYADGNAASGTPISRFVLDGPVFHLNVSGPRADVPGLEHTTASSILDVTAPLLVDQLSAMGFDALTMRRGTLHVTSADGGAETIHDIQAELSGRRKGYVTARGSFTIRGQQLAFDGMLALPPEKRSSQRWPMKVSLKGDLLEAGFDGYLDAAADLRLAGYVEITSPSLRRLARWFGVPVSSASGLNATTVKGQLNWARETLAVEDAKVAIDGNEATGALSLDLKGARPLIDATLAFSALDLTPYTEAARSHAFLFDRQAASWSAFDLSFPILLHVDADVRLSAPKVTIKSHGLVLGRGAATIAVRSGKLLADIAELEVHAGKVNAQVTVNSNETLPRYTVRGKIESFDAGSAATALLGSPVITGRSTLSVDLQGTGQTPVELLRRLSGKATLAMADGGRVGLDMKALKSVAKSSVSPGWGPLAKAQTSIENVEARAVIRNGVLFTEVLRARSGAAGIAASGRVDLAERTLDLRLLTKPGVPTDRPLKSADMAGAESVTVRGSWLEPFVRAGDGTEGEAIR